MNSDLTWPSDGVFYLPSIKRVPIPLELLCEPWSDLRSSYDITKRPDFPVQVHRSRFRFEISSEEAGCSIGGQLIYREYKKPTSLLLPTKNHSTVSVISVCDMYGLEVACSFLKYNYDRAVTETYNAWMSLYFLGSLIVIDSSYRRYQQMPELDCLCSIILLRLIQLDYCQPRLTHELIPVYPSTSCPFPPEVLALITGNATLCKSVCKQVKLLRAVLPTIEDLQADHLDLCTYVLKDGSCIVQSEHSLTATHYLHLGLLLLTREFSVVCKSLPYYPAHSDWSVREMDGAWILSDLKPSVFSVRDYLRWMKHRGCTNRVALLRRFLEEKLASFSKITEENRIEACAWLTQIIYDRSHRDRHQESEVIIPDLESLGCCLRGIMRAEIDRECQ